MIRSENWFGIMRFLMRTTFSGHRWLLFGSCARRKEMCRLAGRHFFHFIAGTRAVNHSPKAGNLTQLCRKRGF